MTDRRVRWVKWALWVLILLAIGLAAGAGRIWLSDFIAINGDFQTYNVLRRFLDGQVPYRDFTNYLGMGVLWLNAPFLLLRNTFTASLFITNALTAVLCSVTVWLIVWLVTRRQTLSMAVGALTPLFYQLTGAQGVFLLFIPGTSMRMARAFLPVLLAGVLLLATYRGGWDSLSVFHSRRAMALCGGALGLGAVWANDFGYSSIGAGMCILLVLTIFRNRERRPAQKLLDYLCFLGCAAAAYLLMVTAVTCGSPQSFFSQSAGVTSYQFWYYNILIQKFFTLKELLTGSPETARQLLAAAVILSAFVVLYVLDRLTVRGICLLYIELTAFFAHLLYGYGSGHYLSGFLRMVNVLFLIGLALRLALKLLDRLPWKKLPRRLPTAAAAAVLAALCLWNGNQAREKTAALFGPREGDYVPALDGWFSNGGQLMELAGLLEGEAFFSTYATALETINGVYQPSGTDYIIHALGDRQREAYLENFLTGEYPYAVTIRKDYNLWEWWVQRANWYFYRALYADYVPAFAGEYAQVWRRQAGGARLDSTDYTVTTQRVSGSAVRISIQTGETLAGQELVADVALGYETRRTGFSLHHAVMIDDGTLWEDDGVYFLREGSQSTHIPILIRDGVGEATVVARPEEESALLSVTARVEQLFDQALMDSAFYG